MAQKVQFRIFVLDDRDREGKTSDDATCSTGLRE